MAPRKSAVDIPSMPPIINLIGSNKGGVGKSFACRVIFHTCLVHNLMLVPFDADASTHDFSDIYDEVPESNVLSFKPDEAIDSFNPVINAMEQDCAGVLVNMPSNIDQIFEHWFFTNDISSILQSLGCQMRIWYVITGDYDAYMNLFVSLKKYGDFVSHVVVKNNISSRVNWQDFDASIDLQSLIDRYHCPIIEIPHLQLAQEKINSFRSRKLKWSAITQLLEPGFGIVERSRVNKFLMSCDQQITAKGLI
jgi:hypothetical protein